MKAFMHPHVMGILGICLADQTPYIVMPFMANGSLHSYLRNTGQSYSFLKMKISIWYFIIEFHNALHIP